MITYNCYYEKVGNVVTNITDELPFDIPNNWAWIRFNNLVNFSLGKTPVRNNQSYWDNGTIPWVSISDMKEKQIISNTKEKITIKALDNEFGSHIVKKGTLLMSFKLTIGRVSILGIDAVHNEAIINIIPILDTQNTIRDYLFYVIGIIATATDKTTAIKGSTLNKEKINSLLIPIPPLLEQRKIIEKIDQTEPLVSKYEKYEYEVSLLESTFEEKLKSSILQYAIEGKLVKQNPNDEPASILLERIKLEKEKLIKDGKIKRDKNDSYIYECDDKNYYGYKNLPTSWILVKAKQLTKKIQYGLSVSGQKNGKYKLLRITDIQNGQVNWNTLPFCDITEQNYLDYKTERDDIFIARTGGTIGKSFRLVESKENVVFAGYLIRFQFVFNNMSEYISYFLNSSVYWKQVSDKSIGTGQPNINGVSLGNLLLPIPPIEEQKRINDKIRQIFTIITMP